MGSGGGYLAHFLALREFWERHDRFWVTFDIRVAASRLAGERTYCCYHPTNRNLPNLVRGTLLGCGILRPERPEAVISSGAAVAVPFSWLGRLVGSRTAFIEVINRVDGPPLTRRLVRPVAISMLAAVAGAEALLPQRYSLGSNPVILGTLGTRPQPMDLPLQELDRLVENGTIADEVIVQSAGDRSSPRHLRCLDFRPADGLDTLIASADVVVTHAGPGLLAAVRAAGKVPSSCRATRDVANTSTITNSDTHRTSTVSPGTP